MTPNDINMQTDEDAHRDSVPTTAEANPKNKPPEPTICEGCGVTFPSRTAVFKHLKETDGACLSKEAYNDFVQYVRKTTKPKKVVLLYGYLPCPPRIRNGQDAGTILLQATHRLQNEMDGIEVDQDHEDNGENDGIGLNGTQHDNESGINNARRSLNRSYGNSARAAACLAQDEDTGAITEVLTARMHPLRGNMTVEQWLDRVQSTLDNMFREGEKYMEGFTCTPIRILGRQDMPNIKFNAEMDVTFRRIEYLLPIGFLTWSIRDPALKKKLESSLSTFTENHKHNISHVTGGWDRPETTVRAFLLALKMKMKLLTTHIVNLDVSDKSSVMEKGFCLKKRKQVKKRQQTKKPNCDDSTNKGEGSEKTVTVMGGRNNINGSGASAEDDPTAIADFVYAAEQRRLLKRKRFHNFTENLMAHEYLACRRLDRFYHRATLKFSSQGENLSHSDETIKMGDPNASTYIVLSMSGDMFLTGQVFRIIGVFLALANGVIDQAFAECVFDEAYPHLIPTPVAPGVGMVAGEAHYMTQEGKTKSILSPRVSSQYSHGWNNESTLYRVKDWQEQVYGHIARKWKTDCRDPATGRLQMEKEWTERILLPWAEKARCHLKEYQLWSKSSDKETTLVGSDDVDAVTCASVPSIPETRAVESMQSPCDLSVPEVYGEVLRCLRQLDSSGRWPSTTPKRQLVMISTAEGEESKEFDTGSLSMAIVNAKSIRPRVLSAYSFAEGQGGASGSFSVGIMPGGGSKQPKANAMFPELVKAAFELELKLCPEREPSSTIAINRNAQFRPHTDSGAGAGQSTSLIVGLGTYSGGELMVEGEKHDIRYKAIEFNGWKQRHWTMPFKGERYSLVWFTPKGCEGLRGIDLDLKPDSGENQPTADVSEND